MPEWFKGLALRSSVVKTRGFEPHWAQHEEVKERDEGKVEKERIVLKAKVGMQCVDEAIFLGCLL